MFLIIKINQSSVEQKQMDVLPSTKNSKALGLGLLLSVACLSAITLNGMSILEDNENQDVKTNWSIISLSVALFFISFWMVYANQDFSML